MDTKIERVSPQVQQQPASPQSGKSGSDLITASSAPPLKIPHPRSSDDSVHLTASAQAIRNAASSGDTAPVDEKRVEHLKRAVEQGSYSVEPRRVASKIATAEGEKQVRGIR